MKNNFFFKPLVAVAALVLGLSSFAVQSCSQSAEVEPMATSISSNAISPDAREAIITSNKPQLQNIQRVIALGLLDVSVNSEFAGIINQLANATAATGDDWRTSLEAIKNSYPNLATAMQASLLAHGGTGADVDLLNASLYGFTIEGVKFTTGVRLSYKDGTSTVSPVHVIATSQLYPQTAIPAWTYNGTNYEASNAAIHTLVTKQTWTVNLLLADGAESKALYTSQGEPAEVVGGSCCKSRLTGSCWSGGDARRCRCAGYTDYPSSL